MEEIIDRDRAGRIRNATIDTEDGTYGNIDIYIAGAIERIKDHYIFWFLLRYRWEGNEIFQFFRRDGSTLSTVTQAFNEFVIGIDIQFLHRITGFIFSTGDAKEIDQARLIDLTIDDLGSDANVPEQVGELPSGAGIFLLLFKDKLI